MISTRSPAFKARGLDAKKLSKSEALRRAIRAAATAEATGGRQHLDRLDRLQRALALSPAKAKAWVRDVRAERRSGAPRSSKSERR